MKNVVIWMVLVVCVSTLSVFAENKAESPVWVKIIFDGEFSNKGKVWDLAQRIYGDLASLSIPDGKPDDLFSIGAGVVEKAGGQSIEAFRKKYGEGKIERAEKGVTYYCFGPISLGFKSDDKSFTWLRAPNRMFREGFITVAKRTSK